MKKRFKGFTLIECLVALGVLGIASLTMAQIYANVSRRNTMNHLVNTSLSNQMAYVEKYTGTEAIPVYYGGAENASSNKVNGTSGGEPPHVKTSGDPLNFRITKYNPGASGAGPSLSDTEVYSYPADVYVLLSRDRSNKSSKDSGFNGAGYDESNFNLRYKYIQGHGS